MKRVVFLGAKQIGYECLDFLLKEQKKLSVEIAAVFANTRHVFSKKYDFRKLCAKNKITFYDSLADFDEIKDIDIIISVQYNEILLPKHINKAKQIAVNLHMAPLPEYRGSNQFSFAIINKAKYFGATIHRLEKKVDAGDILFEKRFLIPDNCWVKNLYDLTYRASIKLFKEHLKDIVNENYALIPQKKYLRERKTSFHLKKEINHIKQINLKWKKEKIERYIRATYFPPFDPPFAISKGKKIYFTSLPQQS